MGSGADSNKVIENLEAEILAFEEKLKLLDEENQRLSKTITACWALLGDRQKVKILENTYGDKDK